MIFINYLSILKRKDDKIFDTCLENSAIKTITDTLLQ